MPSTTTEPAARAPSRQWMCANCGYVYVQANGDPAGGIPPGTAWENIPENWKCPDCGAQKSDFEMVEF
jgi:rubredoxin